MFRNRYYSPNPLFAEFLGGIFLFCSSASGQQPTSVSTNSVSYQYAGTDGTVDFAFTTAAVGSSNTLGGIRVKATINGVVKTDVSLQLTAEPADGSLIVHNAACAAVTAGPQCQVMLATNSGPAVVTVQPRLTGRTWTADVQADQPVISAFVLGDWPAAAGAAAVAIPYYSGNVDYFSAAGLFAASYIDWAGSNGAEFNNNRRVAYPPKTNGARNALRERVVITMAANVNNVFPPVSNPASPYISPLAGRTVIDIWGPPFGQIADSLRLLGGYGLKDCVVLIHDWQRSGYDNALPAHIPANAELGGDDALRSAVNAGQEFGCYAGVHENYVDYYPNYDYFTTSAIARTSQNSLMLSWLNPTTGIQSYGTRPSWFVTTASPQSPAIHRNYNTSATFIDVNSSVTPWWRVDMDAEAPGAGQSGAFRDANAALWSYERQTHGGPVFGEGLHHWFWSGRLDGVEAALGAGVARNLSTKAPLFVDFDLLRIHPLQVNHGMGYYNTWVASGEDISRTDLLDAYRMQEVIYGHAPFIGGSFWNNPARVLLEQNLVSPVAGRYGTQTAAGIQYYVKSQWTDSSAAAKARDWSRVQVRYANGDTIVANGQSSSLTWQGYRVPQYGWIAQGTGLLAYTAVVNGIIGDYAETATSYFANARNQADLRRAGGVAEPKVSTFQQTGPSAFRLQIGWSIYESPGTEDLSNFIHFVTSSSTSGDGIAFATDRSPTPATSQWKSGQTFQDAALDVTVPAGVPDGTYSVRAGLYSPQTFQRAQLVGSNDGQNRYILGTLKIANSGKTISFQAEKAPAADARLNSSGAVVDFSTIRTDGMVSLRLEQDQWVLRVYPAYRDVYVQLNAGRIPPPASMTCDTGQSIQPGGLSNGYWQPKMNGARSCHWPAP